MAAGAVRAARDGEGRYRSAEAAVVGSPATKRRLARHSAGVADGGQAIASWGARRCRTDPPAGVRAGKRLHLRGPSSHNDPVNRGTTLAGVAATIPPR